MRAMWRGVAAVLAIAVAVHVAIVLAVPHLVMQVVMHRFGAVMTDNAPLHVPPIDARARGVPLPSPDLLYSSCVLDLSRGPVLVSVTPGAAYLSLALFDMRSDNVFVTNDDAFAGRPIRVLVTAPGQAAAAPDGAVLAQMGGTRGLLLLRGLAATPELARISEAARLGLVCKGSK